MHPTHDWFTTHLAFERTAAARSRADAHRLRVATGRDARTRAITALGAVADRLRAADVARRSRAEGDPRYTVDDPLHAVRPA